MYRNFVFVKPKWILAQFTNYPTIRPSSTTRIICCTTFCTGAFLRTVTFSTNDLLLAPQLRFACCYSFPPTISIFTASPAVLFCVLQRFWFSLCTGLFFLLPQICATSISDLEITIYALHQPAAATLPSAAAAYAVHTALALHALHCWPCCYPVLQSTVRDSCSSSSSPAADLGSCVRNSRLLVA